MYRRILGFQRLVWCPKWTPASSSWRMVTTIVWCVLSLSRLFVPCTRAGRDPDVLPDSHPGDPGTAAVRPGHDGRLEDMRSQAGHAAQGPDCCVLHSSQGKAQ